MATLRNGALLKIKREITRAQKSLEVLVESERRKILKGIWSLNTLNFKQYLYSSIWTVTFPTSMGSKPGLGLVAGWNSEGCIDGVILSTEMRAEQCLSVKRTLS